MQQTSARQCGGPVACEHLPITSKHSSSQQPGPPPSFCPPPSEDTSMLAAPCIIPCCAVDWPQLDMPTCSSPAQQQQQQLPSQHQPHHVMRQPQQQCRSPGSPHSSSAEATAPQQQHALHALHAVTATHCRDDRDMDDTSSPISLAASECLGQAGASRPVCSNQAEASRQETSWQQEAGRLRQKKMSRQQTTSHLQETHSTSGRDGSAVGEGMVMAQGSNRAFMDVLQPCSPSGRCSPAAAALAGQLLTGQPHLSKVLCVVSHAMCSFSAASDDLEW